ncbi:MAG: hypothetical protein CMJ78_15980 [Planctomycetaceae bacterium]|nr:hypothetical protein [Planctomycetaceae bacterium]
MATPVTVTCPECGAQLKLKNRASPGKKKPCPKCGVSFVLDTDTDESSYSLDLDARGAAPSESPPMLKRGEHSRPRKPARDDQDTDGSSEASGIPGLVANNPVQTVLAGGGLLGLGIFLAYFIFLPSVPAPAPNPAANNVASNPPSVASNNSTPTTPAPVNNTSNNSTSPNNNVVANNTVATNSSSNNSTPPSPNPPRSNNSSANASWDEMQSNGFDLFASVNPAEDVQRGNWERDGTAIISRGNGILPLKL